MLKGGALGAVLLLLALAPSASAWTKLGTGGLDNAVDPSTIVLANGKTLVAYREPKARAVVVAVNGAPHTVASGLASVGDPRLVQLPNGSLVLFVADQNGVESYSSANGASWSGPVKTASADTGDVQAAGARADGTPLFSQDGTGFVNVYQGAGAAHNVFARCCGYAESLAVDSHGLGQIAFWSNATGKSGYLWGRLDTSGALVGALKTLSGSQTAENDARVPLAADSSGNAFVGFANGSPAAAFVVETLRDGVALNKVTLATGSFTGNEPLMALDVDRSDRLWAVWTQGTSVWAARSRSYGAHFGAAVKIAIPGSAYVLEAAAQNDGSIEAIVNDGTALQTQRLLPGLTVLAVPHGVRVLDDGFPVGGASVHGAGKTVKTSAAGNATFGTVPAHTIVSVTATGYAAATGATG